MSDQLTLDTIAELRTLEAAATKLPWVVDETKALGAYFVWQADTLGTPDAQMVCRLGFSEQSTWLKEVEKRTNDGHLIAAIRNHAPALFDAAEKWVRCEDDARKMYEIRDRPYRDLAAAKAMEAKE